MPVFAHRITLSRVAFPPGFPSTNTPANFSHCTRKTLPFTANEAMLKHTNNHYYNIPHVCCALWYLGVYVSFVCILHLLVSISTNWCWNIALYIVCVYNNYFVSLARCLREKRSALTSKYLWCGQCCVLFWLHIVPNGSNGSALICSISCQMTHITEVIFHEK